MSTQSVSACLKSQRSSYCWCPTYLCIKTKMAVCFVAWCSAPVNRHLPTVNLLRKGERFRWKEFELLHVSASLWHIDRCCAKTWRIPGSFPLLVLLSAAVTAECFFVLFLPSKVAAFVLMQLLGSSGTFVLLFLLFGHLQCVFAWLKNFTSLSNSVPVLGYKWFRSVA